MAKETKKNDPFHDVIEKHLKERAAKEPLFAKRLENPKKNISDCCTYIINEVKKMNVQGLPDEDVYNLAAHYYDEDNIKVGAKTSCKVVVNQAVELSDAEKEKARAKAIELATAELKEEEKKKLKVKVELTTEEIAEAKQQAVEKIVSETKEKLVSKKKPGAKKADSTADGTDLFAGTLF